MDEDSLNSYSIVAQDDDTGEQASLVMSLTPSSTIPSFLTFTDTGAGTATLTGTPDNSDVGTHAISLRVTDTNGATADQPFDIIVTNTNDDPFFTSSPVTAVDEDSLYSYSIVAQDDDAGDQASLVMSLSPSSSSPSFLTFTAPSALTATST